VQSGTAKASANVCCISDCIQVAKNAVLIYQHNIGLGGAAVVSVYKPAAA